MNLLVTNTRNTQAYSIIRTLRPYAAKIVAAMEGNNRLAARISHAANSRLVDKRYYTPYPAEDWRAGRIPRENTEKEEFYIQTVLQICEAEKIDTIFPSFDPQIYVFSKNKKRFEQMGILIPIPDYETAINPLDKFRTILTAQEVGFPCPKTYLPETENDLRRIVADLGFPLVIKPRFTSGGRGTAIVKDLDELSAGMRRSWCNSPSGAMVQEYIPGKEKPAILPSAR
jgi:biotin carboxylase